MTKDLRAAAGGMAWALGLGLAAAASATPRARHVRLQHVQVREPGGRTEGCGQQHHAHTVSGTALARNANRGGPR
jgi:hypothetical protein